MLYVNYNYYRYKLVEESLCSANTENVHRDCEITFYTFFKGSCKMFSWQKI